MIDPSIQRAQLLYQQQRYDLAADACREALAQTPQNAFAHALLGLCYLQLKKYDEATAEAALAIHQAPDSGFCHYALGFTYLERNCFPEAEAAARQAVRLEPEDPDNWSLLAQSLFDQGRWKDALQAADSGLQFNPHHNACVNLRAMTLVKLGDKISAAQSIAGALQRNPHNALSHANQGWTLLHQNNHTQALEHFREALRLDPNQPWAREGMMQALKARHFLYRMMLRYCLWMSRFNKRGQWGIIIGFWIGIQILRAVQASNPGLAPFIYPLLALYIIFVIASWLADPIFNLTLVLNRFGRHLLDRVQRIGALIVATLLLTAIVLLSAAFFLQSEFLFLVGILPAILTLPTAATLRMRPGLPLWSMSLYTLVLAILGVTSIILALETDSDWALLLAQIAFFGCVLSSLAANILRGMIQKR